MLFICGLVYVAWLIILYFDKDNDDERKEEINERDKTSKND